MPALSLAAELRAEPELRGRPLAIATAAGPRGEVLACSPEAERAGVRVGSGVVHARAACAALTVRVLSPARERAAREALRDAALACAPRAELAPPATGFYAAEAAVFVDARGVGALYRSEAGFAAALSLRAEQLGLPAVVAIADVRGTALIAARQLARASGEASSEADPAAAASATRPGAASTVLVLPPGGDAAFLAPQPLDLLSPADALADSLARFGLRRVGDLLRAPERSLLNRLGPALLPLLALARGQDASPPPRGPDDACFEEGTELEAPIEQQEPLLFVMRGLLARLAERLACRGLAFGALTLACALEGGGRDLRSIGLAAPTLDVRALLRLAALATSAQPLCAAIVAITITTEGAVLRGDQLDFFAPAGPSPSALSRTLAELAALCGAERVGAPALADAHRPDAFALTPFALRPAVVHPARSRTSTARVEPKASLDAARAARPATAQRDEMEPREDGARASGLAVRALRPPLPAAVRSARGAPHWVQSALANGEVLRCAGPWRTTGQWWSDEHYAFDHYDVLTSDGNVVRLRQDLLRERWEIDGVFD